MILWSCISFDTSFLSSYIISFHKITSKIYFSSVRDHGYWFCFFLILLSGVNIPFVIKSSKSLIFFMSSWVSLPFKSLSLMLLVLSKSLCLRVNSIKCFCRLQPLQFLGFGVFVTYDQSLRWKIFLETFACWCRWIPLCGPMVLSDNKRWFHRML